jgi:hypothetical protein
MSALGGVRRDVLRVWMQDGVMKSGYACTFPNKPRGETPAPPAENRALALPRPLEYRVPARQIAGRICDAVLAVLRAMDAASMLRLAGTVSAQALDAWRPSKNSATVLRHARGYRTKRAMETDTGPGFMRDARGPPSIGPPHPRRPVSAWRGASEFGLDILNGRSQPSQDERGAGRCNAAHSLAGP